MVDSARLCHDFRCRLQANTADPTLAEVEGSKYACHLSDGKLIKDAVLSIRALDEKDVRTTVLVLPVEATIPKLYATVETRREETHLRVTAQASLHPTVYIEDQACHFHSVWRNAIEDTDFKFHLGTQNLCNGFYQKAVSDADRRSSLRHHLAVGGWLVEDCEFKPQIRSEHDILDVFLVRWLSSVLQSFLPTIEHAMSFPEPQEYPTDVEQSSVQAAQFTMQRKQILQRQISSLPYTEVEKLSHHSCWQFVQHVENVCREDVHLLEALLQTSDGIWKRSEIYDIVESKDINALLSFPRALRQTLFHLIARRRSFLEDPYLVQCIRGKTLPRPPIWIHRQAGRYLPQYHQVKGNRTLFEVTSDPPLAAEITMQPVSLFSVDAAIIYSDILIIPQALGMTVYLDPAPRFGWNVQTLEQAESLALDPGKLKVTFQALSITKNALSVHERKKFEKSKHPPTRHYALIGFCGGPITIFDYMVGKGRGPEVLETEPKLAHVLLEKITKASIHYLSHQVTDGGADVVQVFESNAGSFPPGAFREYAFPRLKEIALEFKKLHPSVPIQLFPRGTSHSLQSLSQETLYDSVSLDENVTPERARELVGPCMTLQGNFLCDWMYEPVGDIKRKARDMVLAFNRKGSFKRRHIVNLSHGMRPDMSPEALRALVDEVQTIYMGSRQSPLALAQAKIAHCKFIENYPQHKMEIVGIKSKGDKLLNAPLSSITGDKGLFTRCLDQLLLAGTVDIVAHSLKDLETVVARDLVVSAMMERADTRDAIIIPKDKVADVQGLPFSMLGEGVVVGTCSVRRRAQLKLLRPDLHIVDTRGNLNTRLTKLLNGQCDALVLACAGIQRMQQDRSKERTNVKIVLDEAVCADTFEDLISQCTVFPIDTERLVPAVGQGTVALETRVNDFGLGGILNRTLDHYATRRCCEEERLLLRGVEGGCQVPIGILTEFDSVADVVIMDVHVFPKSEISNKVVKVARSIHGGTAAAKEALEHGAGDIVKMWRGTVTPSRSESQSAESR